MSGVNAPRAGLDTARESRIGRMTDVNLVPNRCPSVVEWEGRKVQCDSAVDEEHLMHLARIPGDVIYWDAQ